MIITAWNGPWHGCFTDSETLKSCLSAFITIAGLSVLRSE